MVELSVEGMTCGHCEKTVKSALERVEGEADPAALIAAVAEDGYRAKIIGGGPR